MELLDDLATVIVESKYKEQAFICHKNGDVRFSETAQDLYNQVYDSIEDIVLKYIDN